MIPQTTQPTTSKTRFEVRTKHSHSLEGVFGSFDLARRYAIEAHEAFGEALYVADTWLAIESPDDTRLVWRTWHENETPFELAEKNHNEGKLLFKFEG